MEERETKIGMFRLVQNDQGLKFYEQCGFSDSGRWYFLNNIATEELRNWLNQSTLKTSK